ncbi:MAG: hypothetical protein ACI4UU_03600 [Clostridia bacterium]
MKERARIAVGFELDTEQVQSYFFGNKERKAKFDEIWQSDEIQKKWKKAKRDILKAEGELSQYREKGEEEFFSKLEIALRSKFASVAFPKAVIALIEKEEEKTLEEILLDAISSKSVSDAIEEAVKTCISSYEELRTIKILSDLIRDLE